MSFLVDYIHLQRRYTRSVNLERDLDRAESVLGYVPTSKSIDVLERFFEAVVTPSAASTWTLTGIYGTGKSAFAHFLSALCAPTKNSIRKNAFHIAEKNFQDKELFRNFQKKITQKGLVRAVVTAQREPISYTVIKGLSLGVNLFWNKSKKPLFIKKIEELFNQIKENKAVSNQEVLSLLKNVAEESKTGVLLIVDELGKNLEYIAQNQDDLFLLQQIAELSLNPKSPKILMFCLLHQSFADYAHRLSSTQKNEWAKVQGRFEDITFTESSEQFLRLIGCAIGRSNNSTLENKIRTWAEEWKNALSEELLFENVSVEQLESIYPLHPFTALALPELCKRYAQNDRSLFTFLTSEETHSLTSWLRKTSIDPQEIETLPILQLDQLYDYFVDSAGMAITIQSQFQRWVEIQGRISEARTLEPDAIKVLKTVGIMNLIGAPKASMKTVLQSICSSSDFQKEKEYWEPILQNLKKLSFVTWREQIDELRIWEGSDFDINQAISEVHDSLKKSSLAKLLEEYYSLSPVIAHRHSYRTGTLRYFERHYFDQVDEIEQGIYKHPHSDGILVYWTGDHQLPKSFSAKVQKGKPIIILNAKTLQLLQQACHEFAALMRIENFPQLKSDGVARREVRHRILVAKKHLDHILSQTFDVSNTATTCWVNGKKKKLPYASSLSSQLSTICDQAYRHTPNLWNELLNRSELTSQGVKASRELIEAMMHHESEKRLGLSGYGPERSMYESLLNNTGIHREIDGQWEFSSPDKKSGIFPVWKVIEGFCISATQTPQSLDLLCKTLLLPPYGVKVGLIPLLFTTVLLVHPDDIGVYYDGSFIPILRIEHFKLLDKQTTRFSVKYFGIEGLKREFFKELENVFKPAIGSNKNLRNPTLLSIAKPLIQFIRKLPRYTQYTKQLSSEALALREAVLNTNEPDQLLFTELPKACNFPPLHLENRPQPNYAREIRKKLLQVVSELHHAYDQLLERCYTLLVGAFKVVNHSKLRQELNIRAGMFQGQFIEPVLKRFIFAAVAEDKNDSQWLESLIMIIVEKPAESWNDEDSLKFEVKLSDLARRFMHLAALKTEMDIPEHHGFDARRLTITHPSGREIHRMVWVDRDFEEKIDSIAEEILESQQIKDNQALQQAIITKLIEKVFNSEEKQTQLEKLHRKVE